MGVISFKKKADEFTTPYTCMAAIKKGGIETKLSMVVMGLGNFVHGQKIKGLLFLAVEVAYLVFMAGGERNRIFTDASFSGKRSPGGNLG